MNNTDNTNDERVEVDPEENTAEGPDETRIRLR